MKFSVAASIACTFALLASAMVVDAAAAYPRGAGYLTRGGKCVAPGTTSCKLVPCRAGRGAAKFTKSGGKVFVGPKGSSDCLVYKGSKVFKAPCAKYPQCKWTQSGSQLRTHDGQCACGRGSDMVLATCSRSDPTQSGFTIDLELEIPGEDNDMPQEGELTEDFSDDAPAAEEDDYLEEEGADEYGGEDETQYEQDDTAYEEDVSGEESAYDESDYYDEGPNYEEPAYEEPAYYPEPPVTDDYVDYYDTGAYNYDFGSDMGGDW